jgi:predicted lipoprotein with Yx(FWY)xxD motif
MRAEDDDEDAAVAESYNGDTTEDKGGVVATESTDEAATDEAMTEDATAEAGTTDDTTTDDATTDATTTDEATTSDGAVASGAPADGSVAPATEGIVQLSSNEELGSYLVDANGRTLYRYDLDTAEASACTGDCAQTWVPFTVPADTLLVAGDGVTGSLGAIVRDDGSVQVTYNGSPLYYFADDQQPGDTGGQAVENTWWVVNP